MSHIWATSILRSFENSSIQNFWSPTSGACIFHTRIVTLPFLYFVEINSENGLLKMFPRLFNDLKHCTIDALKECWVQYPHVQVTKPKTNLGKQLLEKMCEDPATVLETTSRSRVWFWWSGLCNTKSNAIASTLTRRSCWLSNKLDAECHLAVFGKAAPFAKFRNKKYTAKGIRNDVTLFRSAK